MNPSFSLLLFFRIKIKISLVFSRLSLESEHLQPLLCNNKLRTWVENIEKNMKITGVDILWETNKF